MLSCQFAEEFVSTFENFSSVGNPILFAAMHLLHCAKACVPNFINQKKASRGLAIAHELGDIDRPNPWVTIRSKITIVAHEPEDEKHKAFDIVPKPNTEKSESEKRTELVDILNE